MPAARHTAETAVVTLRLDLGTETISGTLANERGSERPFWGWLELSAALDLTRGAGSEITSSRGLEEGV